MKINNFNYLNNIKLSNPYSSENNRKSIPISFSGQILTKDERGADIYKFNLPNAPKNSKLLLTVLTNDGSGDYKQLAEPIVYDVPEGYGAVSVNASQFQLDKNNILAYKFLINGKEYTDKGVKGDKNYTLAIPINGSFSMRPRQMEHMLVDSFNTPDVYAAKRNHFNLLGGSLNSVKDRVKDLKEFGIRNILGTPIFGQDNKSSHGYWTTNPYQITNNLGSYKDFSNLMIELYKNGMSWTADGAFVNEGMEGLHIKDIINWGVDSPFISMFETKDVKNVPVRFGIFSKNEDVNKHFHIKLVNAPYKIQYVKSGDYYKESVVKHHTYDPKRPTYIQVFDDRLASEEQMNNDEIFDVYAKKEADDKYEIASSKDAVQAYHFRVAPSEVKINYEKYKQAKHSDKSIEFKDALTQWTNFNLVQSNKDGGVSLWVGNSDISKKRFVLPDALQHAMKLNGDEKVQVVAGQYQVQDDTVQVGRFWTSNTAKILTAYTANELVNKLATSSNMTYADAINSLINENKLPKDANKINEKENGKPSPLENMLSISPVNGKRKYIIKTKDIPENITEGIMSYPMEAIEFSPDLLSVFAYPFIKNLAVTEDTIGKTRYELFKMGDDYYNLMPERYKEIYKLSDKILSEDMTQKAMSILKDVEMLSGKKLFDGDELSTEGKEIYSLLASDITKFLVVSSLAPKIKQVKNDSMLEYNLDDLHKVSLNSLGLQYELSPEDVAKRLLSKIQSGLKNIPSDSINDFKNHLLVRVKNLNSDAINVAKLIIDSTESGLDWRIDAAKDVGDWDSKEADKFGADANKKAILSFWNRFNKAVREQNPRSYTIGEVTDWSELPPSEFIRKTGFTTISDYEYFYNALPEIYGQDSEGKSNNSAKSVVENQLKNYYDKGLVSSLNFMHRFVGNQDKPRILHLLAMDVKAFNNDKAAEVRRVIENGLRNSNEFKNLPDNLKNALVSALYKLQSGKHTVNGIEKESDSENFGIRPFDFTIADIVEEAKLNNNEFENFVADNKAKIEKLKAESLQNILAPAMKKYKAILLTMAGLPGTPTNYAGDEFAMTGWETFCKNEKQENRNALHWDWLENENYNFVKAYRDDLAKIMNIRNKKAASALVNGATIPLDSISLKEGGDAAAFYRYNDKTDAIVVLHSRCYGSRPEQCGMGASVDKLELKGLGFNVPKGTVYVDALDSNKKFVVCDNNIIKSADENGKETSESISLGESGLILLREKDFNNNMLSFKGHIENPNVKLANTKYNFHYMTK